MSLPDWEIACQATRDIARFDGWRSNRELYEKYPDHLGQDVYEILTDARLITQKEVDSAFSLRKAWQETLRQLFTQVDVIAMTTLTDFPPLLESIDKLQELRATHPWNLAGVPALAMPIPANNPLPASLQLVAPWNKEEQLLALGARIEAAVGSHLGP